MLTPSCQSSDRKQRYLKKERKKEKAVTVKPARAQGAGNRSDVRLLAIKRQWMYCFNAVKQSDFQKWNSAP